METSCAPGPKTEFAARRLRWWVGIGASRFQDWKARFGKVNEHNACVPGGPWLTNAEKERSAASPVSNRWKVIVNSRL